MRYLILIFSLFCLNENGISQTDYDKVLAQIRKDKISLRQNKVDTDSIKNYLLTQYDANIFPFWKGRPWDYNGYTNSPYKGEIACGYFVSTTLKHLGFNWNRYELAKMYSQQIVEDITDTAFVFNSILELSRYLEFEDNNIYILGLSSHVGLIVKQQDKIWFVHSNYYGGEGPIKEKLNESYALRDSDVFWCGKFLTPSNIKMWLNNSKYGLVRKK